ncbi:uncharacterized protein K452DRAFT_312461 [Aplosporella prunicola CBS 121167]|uniref:Uncharacterized protein n=1 Tax=Aplosporella prunicola CBS 121167 TaxID=1176127 RepID=A0A6A6B1P4_9PEZI|nr:uncharacterized protein K452DRAFT_312461 [Aplosporella prunicola CBS 121167]KAF2137293.1 hypothetical protein K452DRAFT_312461 [Aplosporella prunicola CBS 121167]
MAPPSALSCCGLLRRCTPACSPPPSPTPGLHHPLRYDRRRWAVLPQQEEESGGRLTKLFVEMRKKAQGYAAVAAYARESTARPSHAATPTPIPTPDRSTRRAQFQQYPTPYILQAEQEPHPTLPPGIKHDQDPQHTPSNASVPASRPKTTIQPLYYHQQQEQQHREPQAEEAEWQIRQENGAAGLQDYIHGHDSPIPKEHSTPNV